MIKPWLRFLLLPVMWLAAAGLVASLAVHVLALAGVESPLGNRTFVLHVGVFVVWLPVTIAGTTITRWESSRRSLQTLLRDCPRWMRMMTYGFFGYAFINFTLFMFPIFSGGGVESDASSPPADIFRAFSGHWMAFYSIALAASYGITHARVRRCPVGHQVGPADNYCTECGQPAVDTAPGQATGPDRERRQGWW